MDLKLPPILLIILKLPSRKLTFSPLKMDGWNRIVSFWGPACFQGRTVSFWEGRWGWPSFGFQFGCFGDSHRNIHHTWIFHAYWANYNDVSRRHPKWWFNKGTSPKSPKNSGLGIILICPECLALNWMMISNFKFGK